MSKIMLEAHANVISERQHGDGVVFAHHKSGPSPSRAAYDSAPQPPPLMSHDSAPASTLYVHIACQFSCVPSA